MFYFFKRLTRAAWVLVLAIGVLCASCAPSPQPSATPPPQNISATLTPKPTATPQASFGEGTILAEIVPEAIRGGGGEPVVHVYVMDEGAVRDMPIEEYLCGVLAGEMKNDWPMEALRAQAIIARTFALKFIEDKGGSKYQGAHLSTDITEAQAYDEAGVNERIREAIDTTRGEVIVNGDGLIYAWFHAHSGGMTALAEEGLEYEREEPSYTQVMDSSESPDAPPEDAQWEASFSQKEMADALSNWGIMEPVRDISIKEWGPSGRALTLSVNGETVSAPSLRLRLGGTVMKSTLLTGVSVAGDKVVFSGKGYGHGVGMSQWGAYRMAEEGEVAEQIIQAYFADVQTVRAWE